MNDLFLVDGLKVDLFLTIFPLTKRGSPYQSIHHLTDKLNVKANLGDV